MAAIKRVIAITSAMLAGSCLIYVASRRDTNPSPYTLILNIPAAFADIQEMSVVGIVTDPYVKDRQTGRPLEEVKSFGILGDSTEERARGSISADGIRLMQEFRSDSPCDSPPPSREAQYQFSVKCFRNSCDLTYAGNFFSYEEISGKLNRKEDSKRDDWCTMSPVFRDHFLRYAKAQRAAIRAHSTPPPSQGPWIGGEPALPSAHPAQDSPGQPAIRFRSLTPHR